MAEDVGGVDVVINLTVTDASARDRPDWKIELSNRALHTSPGHSAAASAAVTLDRSVLIDISAALLSPAEAIDAGRASIDGERSAFEVVFDHLDVFMSMFPIVEP